MVAGLLLGGAAAEAQTPPRAGKVVMKVAVLNDEQSPLGIAWKRFGQLVDRRTNGAIEVQVFANSQLGAEKAVADGMRIGSVQAGAVSLAVLSAWVPEGQLFELPFLFRDFDHAEKVLNGPIGERMKERYPAHGFRVLDFANIGVRHPISKTPINALEDVKGKRIRVIQSPLHIALWRSLGANPTPIPVTETYNALQSGLVDMMDMNKNGYSQYRLYEVAPNFVELGHIYTFGAVIIAEQVWRRLPPEHQAAVTQSAHDIAFLQRHLEEYMGELALADAIGRGAKVTRPAREPWEKAMLPIWQEFAAKIGGTDAIQEILAVK